MRWQTAAIGIQLALGLSGFGCGVPEYRINVTAIPDGTTQLQVAAYRAGTIAQDSPTFAVTGPRDSFSFGLNLDGVESGQAAVSVAARREDGCILAVGTRSPLPDAATGGDAELDLATPSPAVSTAACTQDPPVILSVIRRQEGPLQSIRFSLLLQGWGFQPAAALSIQSTALVQCATGSDCNTACPTTCSGMGMAGPGSGTCLTDCKVATADSDSQHSGPGLVEIDLDPAKNLLQRRDAATENGGQFVQPIDLLQLLSQPLKLTLTNPDGTATSFEESPLAMTMP